jgi:hypothetical protein
MTPLFLVKTNINTQPELKATKLEVFHKKMIQLIPECRLWFLDGKNEKGKIVANPNIGYGTQTISYADGKTKDINLND